MADFAVPLDLPELVLGGGLGVAYVAGEEAPTITQWGNVLLDACAALGVRSRGQRRARSGDRRLGGDHRLHGRHDQGHPRRADLRRRRRRDERQPASGALRVGLRVVPAARRRRRSRPRRFASSASTASRATCCRSTHGCPPTSPSATCWPCPSPVPTGTRWGRTTTRSPGRPWSSSSDGDARARRPPRDVRRPARHRRRLTHASAAWPRTVARHGRAPACVADCRGARPSGLPLGLDRRPYSRACVGRADRRRLVTRVGDRPRPDRSPTRVAPTSRRVATGTRVEYSPDLDGDPDPARSSGPGCRTRTTRRRARIAPWWSSGAPAMTWPPYRSRRRTSGHGQVPVGTGAWDRSRRPSFAKVDRLLDIDPERDVRREGAVLDRRHFDDVVAGVRPRTTTVGRPPEV